MVLCHGFLGTRGTMLPLTKRFQSDGRVVFSYHHGMFQLQSLRASAEELAENLRRLQRDLGVQKLDMVGFSMGGLIALHAVKFCGAADSVRRLALLGAPLDGTWVGLAGAATVGAISQSVWQVLPTSGFLRQLRETPHPAELRVRQIHATDDGLCPQTRPLRGIDLERDYMVLPGGHSSLVVDRAFYAKLREFFDEDDFSAAAEAAE